MPANLTIDIPPDGEVDVLGALIYAKGLWSRPSGTFEVPEIYAEVYPQGYAPPPRPPKGSWPVAYGDNSGGGIWEVYSIYGGIQIGQTYRLVIWMDIYDSPSWCVKYKDFVAVAAPLPAPGMPPRGRPAGRPGQAPAPGGPGAPAPGPGGPGGAAPAQGGPPRP
jgi:hypothetical protein